MEREPFAVTSQLMQLLQTDISSHTHAVCLDILEKFGTVVSLEEVRQDSWFEDLQKNDDDGNLALVARIVGPRYLAWSILLGLQIRSITQSELHPDTPLVEFTNDTEMIQKLPLPQFNLQVTTILLSIGIHGATQVTLPLTDEQAEAIIGELPLMVAPLFELSPTHLIAVQNDEKFECIIGVMTQRGHVFLALDEFHKLILQLLQFDIQRIGTGAMVLDFSTEAAKEAFGKNDFQRVVALLETWPGLLSTLLKSPAQRNLTPYQLEQIGEGCSLLAAAFIQQQNHGFAKEVLRLGIRYVADTPHAAQLYFDMGMLLIREQQFGEAIGYLRRVIALSEHNATAWAALGKALHHQNRNVAAWLVLAQAAQLGADEPLYAADRDAVKQKFVSAQLTWPC